MSYFRAEQVDLIFYAGDFLISSEVFRVSFLTTFLLPLDANRITTSPIKTPVVMAYDINASAM
jgi:hypothetical protein